MIPPIPPIVDWLCRGAELASVLGMAWKVIGRLNRDESLKADYPPHRHINGSIIYPDEYPPAKIERIAP